VFEDGNALSEELMQQLARQFNLSETTFLLSPRQRTADARVRIFTPRFEMPFAGHPTLGTAAVCRSLGLAGDQVRLEMIAGLIEVRSSAGRWSLGAPRASWRELTLPPAQLAAGLGVSPEDLAERALWVSAGREQLIVPLRSVEAVQRAMARPELFAGRPSRLQLDVDADGQISVSGEVIELGRGSVQLTLPA
jgi:PhzF family phenazine biosynthesis protein